MKNERISQRLLDIVRLVRATFARVTPQRGPTPVPACVRRRSASTRWLPHLVGFVLLAAVPAWAGVPVLPAGVPNIYDPAVQAHFQLVGVENVQDNPDLPVVLLLNTDGAQPQLLLLAFDARNGKDTWSLLEDPVILIAVSADKTTLRALYVDTGFAAQGKASGAFTAVDPANGSTLSGLLKAFSATSKRTNL